MNFEDLTGKRFTRLTVLGLEDKNPKSRKRTWICLCDCGKQIIVKNYALLNGNTKSCGCLKKEQNRNANKTHGLSRTPIYRVWGSMVGRCTNPKDHKYASYGGRGINVCARWRSFENFYADVSQMEHFGEKGYSLDRINNNGDYEPNNVRWANLTTQGRNKRNNHMVKVDGEQMTVSELCEHYNLNPVTVQSRIKKGDAGLDLIRPPYTHPKKNNAKCKYFIMYKGEQITLSEAAKIAHVSYNTMVSRYKKGLKGEDLFKTSWYERKYGWDEKSK